MKKGVYLVGAGPGDPKLMTIRGLELLENCDVIVYDQLANPLFLTYAKKECKKIYVGKKAGNHTMKQEDINKLLLELTTEYKIIVRLKGGDPYVFGRGSEEAEFLIGHHVYVEVVPGITSAIGGLTAAGIPITARNVASSFHVITGHVSEESEPVNYKALAELNGTLVFLMGLGNLHHIVSELLSAGKNVNTEAAIIYKASTPEQKIYIGTLGTIDGIAKENDIKSPALIVIGPVVSFNSILLPKEKDALEGIRVVVTRAIEGISKFSDQLSELGATVVPMPVIKFKVINSEILKTYIHQIEQFDGLIFSSSMSVDVFFDAMFTAGRDTRYLMGKNVVAVGDETSKVLRNYGIIADQIPEDFSKEGILSLFENMNDKQKTYLLPRSDRSDSNWLEKLKNHITPIPIDCYTTEIEKDAYWNKDLVEASKYITFTSTSTVEGFIERLDIDGLSLKEIVQNKRIVAIGPATKRSLESNEIHVDIMPTKASILEMVNCIYEDCKEGKDEIQ